MKSSIRSAITDSVFVGICLGYGVHALV
jgi:hypothetical protein